MKRPNLAFTLGILLSAICINAISVYIFHDVDHDQIGLWNEAFLGLCEEMFLFSLVIGGLTGLIVFLGRLTLHLRHSSPRITFAFLLGLAVPVIQYLWDFLTRSLLPALAQTSLLAYLLIAPVLCAFLLLRDSRRQNSLS